MKIALLSDLHLSRRPPSSCTESYCDDLFDLIRQARAAAAERHCTAMVWAGDIFHCKAASRVPYELVHRLCDLIHEWPYINRLPVFITYGNHDIANDRGESVMTTQPLGMLFRAGARPLEHWESSQEYPLYGVPWQQGYGSYTPESVEAVEHALRYYRPGRSSEQYMPHALIVTHAPLYPPGKELEYEYFPAQRWAELVGDKTASVFYGHVHEPHGVYQAEGVQFCNNGALSRGSLHEYNLTRQVGVTIWDSEDGLFEFVPLDARPASEVFRLTEKQQATDIQGRLDDFLAGVGEARLEVMSVETVIEHIRSLGLGKNVEDLATELLEEAQHGSH